MGLYIPDVFLLQTWSVFQAAIHSFCLVFLYSVLLALILFIGNLAFHRLAGSIAAIGIHFIGYMIISDYDVFGHMEWSLLAHGILAYHGEAGTASFTVGVSYTLFVLIIVLLYCLEHFIIRRCDLRHSISERI